MTVVLVLFGLACCFSGGLIIGAWLSWCSYEEGYEDGLNAVPPERSVAFAGQNVNAPASRERSGAEPRGVSS